MPGNSREQLLNFYRRMQVGMSLEAFARRPH